MKADMTEVEANFSKLFPREALTGVSERQLLEERMSAFIGQRVHSEQAKQQIFPANMFLEGYDQHNRWFLSSMLLSMALTDQAPFKVLKTHGMLVD